MVALAITGGLAPLLSSNKKRISNMGNKYALFFSALKRHPHLTKEQAVLSFTEGQTSSLKDLEHWEVQELIRGLNNAAPKQVLPKEYPGGEKANKMRRAIIAIFRNMGRSVNDAIAWAEKQGAKGQKKPFNDYTTGELYILIGIAEKVKDDWEKGIRKRTSKNFSES